MQDWRWPQTELITSRKPITKPPSAAPVVLPIPPRTAAVNAFNPAWNPMLNTVIPKYRPWTTPAAPARADPTKNVRAIVVLMSTPISWAASRSIAVERMARPSRVLPMNSWSVAIRPTARMMTNRLMRLIEKKPNVSTVFGMICGVVTMELLTTTNTMFWRMKLTPIAVMSGARRGALRRRR